ncbi:MULTISPECIES: DNA-directed RNA polymerase subunit omega [Loigolactobacillus]|uniref:DNA-directed RNA polymerase subunit omega n=1 Tax=Loigolactobacillus backii TaxID=375175 RepID=A0A192H4A7_9LACO|nr:MULTISPECIES: DNA-directed RNA polymerase subunit omega [Loigolactobacillus]ANK59369.1 DNA-directed RNA polymerase subunit omega [Loigolactobacillus backii]ANK63052.1 DNA-directed RNA polymerase subunit omega [Loigolactobacillus backii]ANK64362.1 DNA-directed RNA polymerase subunit omega [Loigolactobacillus backii]ANK67242.1 DNA-directed RNA polymerase subunit omega [Loigolactobacillus backii]ANK69940.1 DNA-directed RNA polymerase subunit omega [Loigolactobacillus backii]
MILYPSIDKLLEKVDSRYSLAVLAAKRAHEIEAGALKMLPEYRSPQTVGQALEEIAEGDVIIDPASQMTEREAEAIDEENKHDK